MKSRDLGKVRKTWFLKDSEMKKHFLVANKTSGLTLNLNFGVTLSRKVDRCTFYIKAGCPHSLFLINVKTM